MCACASGYARWASQFFAAACCYASSKTAFGCFYSSSRTATAHVQQRNIRVLLFEFSKNANNSDAVDTSFFALFVLRFRRRVPSFHRYALDGINAGVPLARLMTSAPVPAELTKLPYLRPQCVSRAPVVFFRLLSGLFRGARCGAARAWKCGARRVRLACLLGWHGLGRLGG